MSNSPVNSTIQEASTNLTASVFEIDILEFCVFGFSFLFGLPTNSYVIWLIITETGGRVASEFFILNLFVCGIFCSVDSLLSFFTKWFPFPSLLALSQFSLGLATTGFPLFQCLMCVERYLAVVHPVTFLKFKPLRYRVICCTVVWIIALGSCLIGMLSFLLIFSIYTYTWFLSVQFLLFISIQLFCCVTVLRALKQSGPGERGRDREEENHTKRRAFHLIVITLLNTVITYAPFTITALISAVTGQPFQILWVLSYSCFLVAGLLPAILYLHRNGKLYCLRFCSMQS